MSTMCSWCKRNILKGKKPKMRAKNQRSWIEDAYDHQAPKYRVWVATIKRERSWAPGSLVGIYKRKGDATLGLRDSFATYLSDNIGHSPYLTKLYGSKIPDFYTRSLPFLVKLWNKAVEEDGEPYWELSYNIEKFEPHFYSFMLGRYLEQSGTFDDDSDDADLMRFLEKEKLPRLQIISGPKSKFLQDVYALAQPLSKRKKRNVGAPVDSNRQRTYKFILDKLEGFKRDAKNWKDRFAPQYRRKGSAKDGWTYYRINLVSKETKISKAHYDKGRQK